MCWYESGSPECDSGICGCENGGGKNSSERQQHDVVQEGRSSDTTGCVAFGRLVGRVV